MSDLEKRLDENIESILKQVDDKFSTRDKYRLELEEQIKKIEDNIDYAKFQIQEQRISELEASSASHTENIDGIRRHTTELEINYNDCFVHKNEAIAELRENIETLFGCEANRTLQIEGDCSLENIGILGEINKYAGYIRNVKQDVHELKEEYKRNSNIIDATVIKQLNHTKEIAELKGRVKTLIEDDHRWYLTHHEINKNREVLRELGEDYFGHKEIGHPMFVESDTKRWFEKLEGKKEVFFDSELQAELDSLLHGIDPTFLKTEKKEVVFNDPCKPCEHPNIECWNCEVYPFRDSGGEKSVEVGPGDSKDEVGSGDTDLNPSDSLTRFRDKVLKPFDSKPSEPTTLDKTCNTCGQFLYAVDSISCSECSRKNEKELISEFVEDLKLTHPMIGFKYTREELIKKWEKKLK